MSGERYWLLELFPFISCCLHLDTVESTKDVFNMVVFICKKLFISIFFASFDVGLVSGNAKRVPPFSKQILDKRQNKHRFYKYLHK